MEAATNRRFPAALLVLGAGLLVSVTAAVTLGPVSIDPLTVWGIVGRHALAPLASLPDAGVSAAQDNIVWLIRLPRVLLAAVVGAALGVVGVAMQAIVRNPIAEPYILGVSSGASVGAVLVILMGWFAFWGYNALASAAFACGLASFAVVLGLSVRHGRINPVRMILVGVAVSYVLSAATTFVTLRARNQEGIQSALFWLAGSVAGAKWDYLQLPTLALVVGSAVLLLQARPMNALVAGEETAATLGVNATLLRAQLMVVSALLIGTAVAVSGSIGFVGLIMPHVARLLFGPDHRRVLWVSALGGAIFLIWVDVAARLVVAPQELPIGILTSLIGGPFFLWLLHLRAGQIDGPGR